MVDILSFIKLHGGKVLPYSSLPAPGKRAVKQYWGEAGSKVDRDQLFAYAVVPTSELAGLVGKRDHESFDAYHQWYLDGGDIPNHKSASYAVLLADDDEEVIWDGWHRFHCYVRDGIKNIPCVFPVDSEEVTEDVAVPSNLPIDPHSMRLSPALMTCQEYLDQVNKRDIYHPDDAYDSSVEQMKEEDYLFDAKKVVRRMIINGVKFEIRLGKSRYSDDPIVVIFNDQNEPVAALQDEYNAVLVRVAREYRGFNLGSLISKIALTMHPTKSSGGLTDSGRKSYINAHREIVRDALTSGLYRRMVTAGKLSMERLREILDSLDLSKKPKKQDRNLQFNDPKDWMIYGAHGAYVIYDKKLRDIDDSDANSYFADKAIKAYILVRFPEHMDGGVVVQFGADTKKLKGFMLTVATACAEEEGKPLLIDEEDIAFVDYNVLSLDHVSKKSGKSRAEAWLTVEFNVHALVEQEAVWRRSFDRYGEFHQRILEMAEAKFRKS